MIDCIHLVWAGDRYVMCGCAIVLAKGTLAELRVKQFKAHRGGRCGTATGGSP